MIVFDKLWEVMKENGVATYRLREMRHRQQDDPTLAGK